MMVRVSGLLGGIDLGGTKIQAVIADEDFTVLGAARGQRRRAPAGPPRTSPLQWRSRYATPRRRPR